MPTALKFLLFLSVLFFLSSCSSPEETKKKPIIVPKKITMLFVTQPSCPSCNQLEETMKLAKPKELIHNYFTVKKVYLGEKLPDGLIPPNGTPTVYFLGFNNEILIEPMVGEKKEQALMEFLEDALLEFNNIYQVDLIQKMKAKILKENNEATI